MNTLSLSLSMTIRRLYFFFFVADKKLFHESWSKNSQFFYNNNLLVVSLIIIVSGTVSLSLSQWQQGDSISFFSWQTKNSFMGHDRKIPSSFITRIIGSTINYSYKRTGNFLMVLRDFYKKNLVNYHIYPFSFHINWERTERVLKLL